MPGVNMRDMPFSGPGIRTQHAIQELNQPQVGGMALDLNQIVPTLVLLNFQRSWVTPAPGARMGSKGGLTTADFIPRQPTICRFSSRLRVRPTFS